MLDVQECSAHVSRGPALLAEARLYQLWRAGGTDCHHADGARRPEEMDRPGAFSPRAQLLHAAARAGGAAARDLLRLAVAPCPRRAGRGRALCAAVGGDIVGA